MHQNEITTENFEKLFSVALSKSQVRGQHQNGKSGTFQSKKLSELSWRGLLRKLFKERSVRIICTCDRKRPKKTAQAIIKHIERRHQEENGGITLNSRDLEVLEGITWQTEEKKSESAQQYLKRLTHVYLAEKSIDEIVSDIPFSLV